MFLEVLYVLWPMFAEKILQVYLHLSSVKVSHSKPEEELSLVLLEGGYPAFTESPGSWGLH